MAMGDYREAINRHARRNNIDPRLLEAIIQAESGGDPDAVSPVGARGLAQVMPATGGDPGYGVEPFDPSKDPAEESIRFGADYFSAMLDEFDEYIPDALSAYNFGPGNTKKWKAGEVEQPTETLNYVEKIKGIHQNLVETQPLTADGAALPSVSMLNEMGVDSPLMQDTAPMEAASPFANEPTTGWDRAGDEAEWMAREFGAGLAETAGLVTDMLDFGAWGEGFSDRAADWLNNWGEEIRQGSADWITERRNQPLFIEKEDGGIRLNPNASMARAIIGTTLGSIGPGGAIGAGGRGLMAGVKFGSKYSDNILKFLKSPAGKRLTPAAAYGAANSAYIWGDTYTSTYDEAISMGLNEDEAEERALAAAIPAASVALVTGGVGGLGIGTQGSRLRRATVSAALGAITEAPEEMTQYAAEQIALGKPIEPARLVEAGVLGAFAAGPTEGAMAVLTGQADVDTKPKPTDAQQRVREQMGVDILADIPVPNASIAAGEVSMDINLPDPYEVAQQVPQSPRANPPIDTPLMGGEAQPTVELPPVEQALAAWKSIPKPESGVVPNEQVANNLQQYLGTHSPDAVKTTVATMAPMDVAQVYERNLNRARNMYPDLDDDTLSFRALQMTEDELGGGDMGLGSGAPPEEPEVEPTPDGMAEDIIPRRSSRSVQNELDTVIRQGKDARDSNQPPEIVTGIDQRLMPLRRELVQAQRYEEQQRNAPPTWDQASTSPTPQNADEVLRGGRFVTHSTTEQNIPGIVEGGLNKGTHVGVGPRSQGLSEVALVFPKRATGARAKTSDITGEAYNEADRLTTLAAAQPTAILYDVEDHTPELLAAHRAAYPELPVMGIRYDEFTGDFVAAEPAATGAMQEEVGLQATSPEAAAEVDTEFTPIQGDTKIGSLEQLVFSLSESLYTSEQVDTTVKELVQNAFDASKDGVIKGEIKPDEAVVGITINSQNRSITVEDQAGGMSADTVLNKFLAIAGTDKGALQPGDRSGGLGLAKVAFLYNNAAVEMRTTKDGVTTELSATRDQLMNKDYQIVPRKATEGEKGTSVTIFIPERKTDSTGRTEDIEFPEATDRTSIHDPWVGKDSFLAKPLLGDVELKLTRIDNDGNASTDILPQGRNYSPVRMEDAGTSDMKMVPITTINAEWGTVEVFISDKPHEYAGGMPRPAAANHSVLSSGVYQFDNSIPESFQMMAPRSGHEIILNVKPKGDIMDFKYPFNNSRESFRPSVKKDVNAINVWLTAYMQQRKVQESVNESAAIWKSPASTKPVDYVNGEVTKLQQKVLDAAYEKLKDAATEAVLSDTVEALPVTPLSGELRVKDGSLRDADDNVLGSAEAAEKVEEAKKAGVQSININDVLSGALKLPTITPVGDPLTDIQIHNNMDFKLMEKAKTHGDPMHFLAEIGSVMKAMMDNYRDAVADMRVKSDQGNDLLTDIDAWVGVSLDNDYHGVQIVTPFKGAFINPLGGDLAGMTTPAGRAGAIYRTMVHEIAHIVERNHSLGHQQQMDRISRFLMDTGMDMHLRGAIEGILDRHAKVFDFMRTSFGEQKYGNIGRSLKDSATTGSLASRVAGYDQVPSGTVQERRGQGGAGPVRAPPSGSLEPQAVTADDLIARKAIGGVDAAGWTQGMWHGIRGDGVIRAPATSKGAVIAEIEAEARESGHNLSTHQNMDGLTEVFNLDTGYTYVIYSPAQRQKAVDDGMLVESEGAPPAPTTPPPAIDFDEDYAAPEMVRGKWNAIDGNGVLYTAPTRKALVDQLADTFPGGTYKQRKSGFGKFIVSDEFELNVYGPRNLKQAVSDGVATMPKRKDSKYRPDRPPEPPPMEEPDMGPEPPPRPSTRPEVGGDIAFEPPGEPPPAPELPPEPGPDDVVDDGVDQGEFDFGPPPDYIQNLPPQGTEEAEDTDTENYAPEDRPAMFTFKRPPTFADTKNTLNDKGQPIGAESPHAQAAGYATANKKTAFFNDNKPPPTGGDQFKSWKNFADWTSYGASWFRWYIQDEHLPILKFEEALLTGPDGVMDSRFTVHDTLSGVPNMVTKANRSADEKVLNPMYRSIHGLQADGTRVEGHTNIPMRAMNQVLAAINAPFRNFHIEANRAGLPLVALRDAVDDAIVALDTAKAAQRDAALVSKSKSLYNKAGREVANKEKDLATKQVALAKAELAAVSPKPLRPDVVGGSGVSERKAMDILRAFDAEHQVPNSQMADIMENVFATAKYLRDEAYARGRMTTNEMTELTPDPQIQAAFLNTLRTQGMEAAMDQANYTLTPAEFYNQMFRATYVPAWDDKTVLGWMQDPEGLDIQQADSLGHVDIFGEEFTEAKGRKESDGLSTQALEGFHRMIYQVQRKGLYANEVAERIYDQALAINDPRFAVVLPEVNFRNSEYSKPAVRKRLADAALAKAHELGGNPNQYASTAGREVPIIRIRRGDREAAVILTDQAYVTGLKKNYTLPSNTAVSKAFHGTTATVKKLITTWNPDFTAGNAPREWMNMILQIDSVYGINDKQKARIKEKVRARNLFGMGEAKKWYKLTSPYVSKRRPSDESYIGDAKTDEDRNLRTFVTQLAEQGAFSEMYAGATLEEIRSDMATQMRNLQDQAARPFSLRRARYLARKFGDILERAANITENAPRAFIGYETYQALIEDGVPHERALATAARAAQNISVNFKRFGRIGRTLGKYFFFFNPAVQGSARTLRAYKMAPFHMARLAAYAMVIRGLNEMLAGDDEDDRSLYEKNVPDWVRERSAVLVIPGTGGEYIQMPLAFGHNVAYAMGEKFASSILGHGTQFRGLAEDMGDEAKNLTSLALSSFTPVPVSRDTVQSNWLGYITPSMIQPFQEMQANRDWRGLPIMPEEFGNAPDALPDSWRVKNADPDSWAESAFRIMAINMNAVTGGDRHKPGLFDLHPKQVEHLMKSYSGSIGSVTTKLFESINAMAMGEMGEAARNMPVLRKFYGLGESRFDDRGRYFELQNRMIQLNDERDYTRKNKTPEEYKAFMELEGDMWKTGVMGMYSATEKRVRQLSRQKAALLMRENRDQAQNDRIERLDQLITDAMIRFNTRYYDRIVKMEDL